MTSETPLSPRPVLRVSQRVCCACRSGYGCERSAVSGWLALPVRGIVALSAGAVDLLIQPSVGVLARGQRPYRVSHPGEDGHAYTLFEAEDEVWDELGGPVGSNGYREIAYGPAQHLLHLVGLRAMETAGDDRLAVEEIAADLVIAVLGVARGRNREEPSSGRRIAAAIQERLLSSISENISLHDLAKGVGRSAFHLSRVFRETTGFTIRHYRLRTRVCAALGRMAAGDADLTKVALEVGFSHHSHMTESFRRYLGVTPKSARQSLRTADYRNLELRLGR